MAGTINLSLSQQFDSDGVPLSGGKLYFFKVGTTTPQNAYQDLGLTIPWPNPMECDASGRIAQFFLADLSDVETFPDATQNIKFRLTDRNGSTIIAADNILIIGPSGGGGGGGGVDATTVLATGDIKVKYGTGTVTGFVRANGRTVGSATSGATERANADAQALFEYLWGADTNLTVSTGRGASANADWLANKQLTLPDARGRTIAALDDMGNTSAARINTLSSTTLGAAGGGQTVALGTTNLPAISYTPAGSVTGTTDGQGAHTHFLSVPVTGSTDSSGNHTHSYTGPAIPGSQQLSTGTTAGLGGATSGAAGDHTHSVTGTAAGDTDNPGAHSHNVTGTLTGTAANLGGSATPMNVLQPTILMTYYIKL